MSASYNPAPTKAVRRLAPMWLGQRPYELVHELQKELVSARHQKETGDVVLLLEHHPVITLGRRAETGNILLNEAALASAGVEKVETGRGGDVTFHGPGQLVAYPILSLQPDRCDVRRYVRDLAEVMIRMAGQHGIGAGVFQDLIGTWVDGQSQQAWPGEAECQNPLKIGAIGVRISRWITMHGFAFNSRTNLDQFRQVIVPCGIADHGICSLQSLKADAPSAEQLAERSLSHFGDVFSCQVGEMVDLSAVSDGELKQEVRARAQQG